MILQSQRINPMGFVRIHPLPVTLTPAQRDREHAIVFYTVATDGRGQNPTAWAIAKHRVARGETPTAGERHRAETMRPAMPGWSFAAVKPRIRLKGAGKLYGGRYG
jgi:hypothetical protein